MKTNAPLAVEPLETVELNEKTDVRVNVSGGGIAGQAGAVRLGIARALEKQNSELRQPLKEAGHLSRDPRKKERKKPGQPGAQGKSSNSANAGTTLSEPRWLDTGGAFAF